MFAQLNTGKSANGILASRVANILRSNSALEETFKPVELVALETSLKEEFAKHQWLPRLMRAVVDEGFVVTSRQLQE